MSIESAGDLDGPTTSRRRRRGAAGLFGPDSVTWRVHADPSMLVGGLRALLIQALHPAVMAGVDQHSDYREDPWGRLRRTVEYVMTTTYGDSEAALAAGAVVRSIHARVRGVDPVTGAPYDAADPELLLWVHNVEVHSFLAAYRRYGGGITAADADRYVSEMVRVTPLVGIPVDLVPQSTAELRDYFARMAPTLAVTVPARRVLNDVLVPPVPFALLPLGGLVAAAAVGLLPRRVRAIYGLPRFTPADAAVRVPVATLVQAMRLILPDPAPLREARRRVEGRRPMFPASA